MTSVTDKEKTALLQIINNLGNGATSAEELKEDNFSWFDQKDFVEAGFSLHAAAGLMSSLEEKGLIQNYEPDEEYGWALTHAGIDVAFGLLPPKPEAGMTVAVKQRLGMKKYKLSEQLYHVSWVAERGMACRIRQIFQDGTVGAEENFDLSLIEVTNAAHISRVIRTHKEIA